MKTIKLVAIIFSFVTFLSCSTEKNNNRKNMINRVVFATGGCFGPCPVQVIDIDSLLTFKYHGVQDTKNAGFYSGKITNRFWDTLNLKFESVKYRQLDSTYEHSVDDLSTELYIYYNGNKVKHIIGSSSSLPDSVMTVYRCLLSAIKRLKFERTTDRLIFPTHVEKPIPKPPIDHVEFPPPEIDSNKKRNR